MIGGLALMIADFYGSIMVISILPSIGAGSTDGESGAISLIMAAVISIALSSLQISLFHRKNHDQNDNSAMTVLSSFFNVALTISAVLLNILCNYLFYNVGGVAPEQVVATMTSAWAAMKISGFFGYLIQIAKFCLALIVSFLGERLFVEALQDKESSVAGRRGRSPALGSA